MRKVGHTVLLIPTLLMVLSSSPVLADVEVDLSAIGGRTESDARIAPGRAPVQLRFPGETPPTRILLTPPASVRQSEEAPRILGPADAAAVDVQPAEISSPPAPAQIPTPTVRAAAPAPRAIEPDPVSSIKQATQNIRPAETAPAASAALPPLVPSVPTTLRPAPTPPVSAPVSTSAPTIPTAPVQEATVPEPPVQVASLPTAQSANHRLRFEGNAADILGATRDELEMVATELMRHDDRIEIQAFAGAAGDVSSDARRLSLKRALNVRKFLVERGVLQSRIDVRALGGARDNGPANRVDILLSRR